MFRSLLRIVDENSEKEFTDYWGNEHILGNMGNLYSVYSEADNPEEYEKKVAFSDLWNRFYNEVIKTPQRFFCFDNAGTGFDSNNLTDESRKTAAKRIRDIFGDLADYKWSSMLGTEDERFNSNEFRSLYNDVCTYIRKRFEIRTPMNVLQNLAGYACSK